MAKAAEPDQPGINEVRLVGRVSGEVDSRELPSGDELVSFRVVVRRPPRRGAGQEGVRRPSIDTIDVACWSARTRTTAARFDDGQQVEVEGSLRRRFFVTGAGRASRYEVEAQRVRRVRASETSAS